MSARDIATSDIQEELTRQGKCFLAFRSELDDIMDEIVHKFSEEQLLRSIV